MATRIEKLDDDDADDFIKKPPPPPEPDLEPELVVEKKGWFGHIIPWLSPTAFDTGSFHRPNPILYLFLGFFFFLFAGALYGLNYYVNTMHAVRTEIKDTLIKKGYSLKDPLIMKQYEEMEKIILLSRLRTILSMAQSLPDRLEKKDDKLAQITSYLDYIKENNLPFNTREALSWLVKQYR